MPSVSWREPSSRGGGGPETPAAPALQPEPNVRTSTMGKPKTTTPDAADQRTGEPFKPASGEAQPGHVLLGRLKAAASPVDPEATKAENAPERPALAVTDTPDPDPDGDHYRAGYFGKLPDADNRPDLTLAGVLGLDAPPKGTSPQAPPSTDNPKD